MEDTGGLVYCKELWTVISGTHLRVTCEIALNELNKAKDQLFHGVAVYKEPNDESDKALRKKIGDVFHRIVIQLREFLGIDALQAWDLLSHYVMWDFRGDLSDVQKLAANDEKYTALMHSIWEFFRKERLFLLKCINLIFTYRANENHPYQVPFADFMNPINQDELFDSLVFQLEKVSHEGYPTKQEHGQFMTHDYQLRWEGSNLREQIEVLNNLIVFMDPVFVTEERFKKILKICIDSRFGRQLESKAVDFDVHFELTGAISYLQNVLLLQCLNLRVIQENPSKWLRRNLHTDLHEIIAGLGNQEEHGPLVLAWTVMMALESRGGTAEDQELYVKLGETAINLGAFKYLEKLIRHHMFRDISSSVTSRAYKVVYDLIVLFANNFEKQQLHDLKGLLNITGPLLRHPKIAEYFWNDKNDGLHVLVEIITQRFPAEFVPFIEVMGSLVTNGAKHLQKLRKLLLEMQNFAEVLNPEIIAEEIRSSWFSGVITISYSRKPLPNSDFIIPERTTGYYLDLDSYLFLWQCKFTVVEAILHEQQQITLELTNEVPHLQLDTKEKVITSLSFVKNLVASMSEIWPEILPVINNVFEMIKKLQGILDTPSKVIALCLDIALLLVPHFPNEVVYQLKVLRIFPGCQLIPNDITAMFNGESCCSQTIGYFALNQEAVIGKYPLLMSYLSYLHGLIKPTEMESLATKTAKHMQIILPGVVFILTEVFPFYETWNFVNVRDGHILAFTCIKVFHELLFVNNVQVDSVATVQPYRVLQRLVIRSLHNTRAGRELLRIVALGESAIQSSMEKEFNWVSGQGMMGIYLVHHSLSVLNRVLLLKSEVLDKHIPSYLESEIYCSPEAGQRLKVVPTVTSYIENIFSPNLTTMAVKLLRRFALDFPRTLLPCLGMEGDAFRSMIFRRLNSNFCSNQHKVALLQFVSTCVDKQPGVCDEIFNLHLGRQPSRKKNIKCDIHGGVLVFACSALEKVSKEPEIVTEPLYGAVVDLICTIWLSESYAVIHYLRTKENFWKVFCAPLLSKPSTYVYAYSQVMHIVTFEIIKFGKNAHSDLLEILGTFFTEETGSHFQDWSKFVARMFTHDVNISGNDSEDTSEIGTPIPGEKQPPVLENVRVAPEGTRTYVLQQSLESQPDNIQLLISWKRLIMVSLKRLPFGIGSIQKVHLSTHLMEALQNELTSMNLKSILLIVELYLVLVTDWHKRLFDDRVVVTDQIRELLFSVASTYYSLPLRVKEAVLALVLRTVECISTQIKQDEASAETLVKASCDIVIMELSTIREPEKTFQVKTDDSIQEEPRPLTFLQILYILMPELELKPETPPVPREPLSCELSLYLLHKLFKISMGTYSWLKNYRFTRITTVLMSGYGTLLYIMATIGMGSHYFNLAVQIIHILVFLAKHGLTTSLMDELLRDHVWLMLIPSRRLVDGPSPWVVTLWAELYKPTVELITRHLKFRKYYFLQEAITFTSMHELYLVDCIHSFRHSLSPNVLELNLTVLYFIRTLVEYRKEWNMNERSHRILIRNVMSCLHIAVVLLMNPLRLKISLKKDFDEKKKKRNNQTNLPERTDGELSLQIASVQKKLLKMTSMCLTIMKFCTPELHYLLELSPQVPCSFITMMSIEFRPVSFEDDDPLPVSSLSTLITLANLCQQSMTRVVRSTSSLLSIASIRSGSELNMTTSVLATDMACTRMVFEMAVEMITIQGLYFVFNEKVGRTQRVDLRRKLYNDMIFFMEYARRCLHVPLHSKSLESRLVRLRAQLDLALNLPLERDSVGPVLPKKQEFAIVEEELREKIKQFRLAQSGISDLKSHYEIASARSPMTIYERNPLYIRSRYPVDIHNKMLEDHSKISMTRCQSPASRSRSPLEFPNCRRISLDSPRFERVSLTPLEIRAEPVLSYPRLRPDESTSPAHAGCVSAPLKPKRSGADVSIKNLQGVNEPETSQINWGASTSGSPLAVGEVDSPNMNLNAPGVSKTDSEHSSWSGSDDQSILGMAASKDLDLSVPSIRRFCSNVPFTRDARDEISNVPFETFTNLVPLRSRDPDYRVKVHTFRTVPLGKESRDVQEDHSPNPISSAPPCSQTSSTVPFGERRKASRTKYDLQLTPSNIRNLEPIFSENNFLGFDTEKTSSTTGSTVSVEDTNSAHESTSNLKRPISKCSAIPLEVAELPLQNASVVGGDSDSSTTITDNESDYDPDKIPLPVSPEPSNVTDEYLCTIAYIFNTIFEVPEFPSFRV